jgi:hypothetical protein
MAMNLLECMPPLTKADCCREVRFAVRQHDPPKYRTLQVEHLGFVSLETAITAMRPLAKRHGRRWPKYREALRILLDANKNPQTRADQPD